MGAEDHRAGGASPLGDGKACTMHLDMDALK